MMRRLFWLLLVLSLAFPSLPHAEAAAQEKVEVFVTGWCPYCRQLESFLKKRKVEYTRYDIEQDARGARLFEELGGGGVPLSRVGKRVVRGYDPEELLSALDDDD
jgi:glutaredoxin